MIIFYDKLSEERARVKSIHYFPEKLSDTQRAQGTIVERIPESLEQIGKNSILYFNPISLELWYEYEDRELTLEEKVEQQQEIIDQLLIDSLMGGA